MPAKRILVLSIAAAVLLTGCDRAVTRIFAPYENDSRNVKRIGTAVGSPIYRIVDDDMKCIAIFTPQGDSAAVSCVKKDGSDGSASAGRFDTAK
ncbi:MAG: hypothetical protein PUG38_05175 [Sutterellaceae bacterium]|nr:hypothetical protein [Sutterellaceae bacterium]MDY2867577.1 hypothetical protein [Mesosutterella sp.]